MKLVDAEKFENWISKYPKDMSMTVARMLRKLDLSLEVDAIPVDFIIEWTSYEIGLSESEIKRVLLELIKDWRKKNKS